MSDVLQEYVDKAKKALEQAALIAEQEKRSFDVDLGEGGVSYTPLEVAYGEYLYDTGESAEDVSLEDFKNRDTYDDYGQWAYGWNNENWMPSSAYC